MITYICIGLFMIFFTWMFFFNDEMSDGSFTSIGSWLSAIAFSIFFGCAVSVFPQMFMRETFNNHIPTGSSVINVRTTSFDIVSFKHDSSLYGSFFLGSGSIGELEYYVYFKKLADGGIKRDLTLSNNAVVYERSDISPRIEWTTGKYRCHWLGRFGFDKFDTWEQQIGDYRIIVPEGTVIQKFEIN